MDDRLGHVEQDTSQLKQDVTVLKQDVSVLREDVGFIKNAVTEQSADLDDHEQRIQHLEREAA
jgi:septal ring factor EnvC (AmiA/AmiB activator)